jgi:hypothetical protein
MAFKTIEEDEGAERAAIDSLLSADAAEGEAEADATTKEDPETVLAGIESAVAKLRTLLTQA